MTVADDLRAKLITWLRKRARPDSGIRYQSRGYDDNPEVVLHGTDATFIKDHFHGAGAAALADALAAQQGPEIKGLEAAWSQFINCRNDPSGDKAEDEAEEQRNVLALSAAIQAVVAEPTQTSGSNNVPPGTPLNAPSVFGFGVPSPHKGEPDVLRDAVAILKRLSILRIPPYDLPADRFLEKAATEIITLVIAAPPSMEGIVLVPEATPNHPEPGADHDRD